MLKNEIEKLVKPYFAEWQTEVDITAVLKYIWEREDILRTKFINNEIEFQKWESAVSQFNCNSNVNNYLSCSYLYISNKPLSLYSPKEELELLNLLKKLK